MICANCGKKYKRSKCQQRYALIENGKKYWTFCSIECALKKYTDIKLIGECVCKRCGVQINPQNAVFDEYDLYCGLDCAFYVNGIVVDNGEFDE